MEYSHYKVAVLFLHPNCNMSCSFCITEDNFDVMTPQQASELLTTLKDERFESVVFGGGEPFLWPDLIALTKEAKQKGFLVQVGTNGVEMPKDFATIPTIDRYVLPIESMDSNTHNEMRFYKHKHHGIITDRLCALKNAGKTVTISTIVTKINIHELNALALLLEMLNRPQAFIHAWHLYQFIPKGRGGSKNAADLLVSEEEYEKALGYVKSTKLSFPVFKRKDMYHSQSVDFFWFQKGKLIRRSTAQE
jgi:MoaA/NifB/PqqE/SkfB family radical SAM enzyme